LYSSCIEFEIRTDVDPGAEFDQSESWKSLHEIEEEQQGGETPEIPGCVRRQPQGAVVREDVQMQKILQELEELLLRQERAPKRRKRRFEQERNRREIGHRQAGK